MISSPECIICSSTGRQENFNSVDYYRCSGCGLLWRTSFTLPEGHYERKHVDTSPLKVAAREENSLSRIRSFAPFADLNHLCDIGTGEGIFLKVLAEEGYEGCFGIEPSEEVGDFTRKHGLQIVKGWISDLPGIVAGRVVNGCSMLHLIEHLSDPVADLGTIYAALKPGAYLIIETPNADSYALRRTNFVHELVYPEHFFLYNPANLKRLLENMGFIHAASGARDFNPKYLNMREALFKLGFVERGRAGDKMYIPDRPQSVTCAQRSTLRQAASLLMQRVLSFCVAALGRSDYMWIIVRKP